MLFVLLLTQIQEGGSQQLWMDKFGFHKINQRQLRLLAADFPLLTLYKQHVFLNKPLSLQTATLAPTASAGSTNQPIPKSAATDEISAAAPAAHALASASGVDASAQPSAMTSSLVVEGAGDSSWGSSARLLSPSALSKT
eukprot:jgi/Chrzof1/11054/Cz05g21260.t1